MSRSPSSPGGEPRFATREVLFGQAMIFLSAACFYGSTVIIEISRDDEAIAPSSFVTGRFLTGFLISLLVVGWRRESPKIYNLPSLLTRSITNVVAVYCFFSAVSRGGAALGNALNMTYPVFIALFAYFIDRARWRSSGAFAAIVAFFGVVLILRPGGESFGIGALWGIASGVAAALSVISLETTRQHHDTNTVLLFVHGFGSLILLSLFGTSLFELSRYGVLMVVASAIIGVLGQNLFTYGAKFITAVENGIISSTRILIAVLCAPFVQRHYSLSMWDLAGGTLLFLANVIVVRSRGR